MSAPTNMPTPFETQRKSEFGVGNSPPRRSIFGNYKPGEAQAPLTPALSPSDGEREEHMPPSDASRHVDRADRRTMVLPLPRRGGEGRGEGESTAPSAETRQFSIDIALARTFIYRLLAKAYEDPEPDGWRWLSSQSIKSALWSAFAALNKNDAPLTPALSPSDGEREKMPAVAAVLLDRRRAPAPAADSLSPHRMRGEGQGEGSQSVFETSVANLLRQFRFEAYEDFHLSYVTCFGHTVRGDCPMNEIEYGDIKADPLFQPHRLADLGAFYSAFGLEMAAEAAERQDYISIELEFMSVLAAKEAYALEHQLDDGQAALCRQAQKIFLREHLGRWTPAFTRRLARMAGDNALGALANFTREFINEDCTRFKVPPGSEDLLLRPIDESSESLCASCGITNLPPGAASSPVEA
jgi:nitrate reductase assembly molybdenum cofactor insertion protein NarJ